MGIYSWCCIILLLLNVEFGFAQTKTPKRVQHYITDENINRFTHWNELFAAEKEKHNMDYVPKMIAILDKPEKYDSLFLVKIVDSIVAFKSYKAMWFTFDLLCRPIDFSKKNSFTNMASTLVKYGGYQALNKHWLKDSIPYSGDFQTFKTSVYESIREMHKLTMSWSVYFVPYEKPKPPKPLPKFVQQQLNEHPQCKSAFLINDSSFQTIEGLNQLLFLSQDKNSKVRQLLDSLERSISKNPDLSLSILNTLAEINSPQVKQLFYVFMAFPINIMDDFNTMNALSPIFRKKETAQIADRVFLNNRFKNKETNDDFFKNITDALKLAIIDCYACQFKTGEELAIDEMKKYDTRFIDKKVQRIVQKHSRFQFNNQTKPRKNNYEEILKDVLSIEGITDAYYDYCRIKIALYPGFITLGIVYWPNDKFAVQKCYPIQIGKNTGRFNHYSRRFLRKLNIGGESDHLVIDLNKMYYKPGFVDAERKECERVKEENRQYENL